MSRMIANNSKKDSRHPTHPKNELCVVALCSASCVRALRDFLSEAQQRERICEIQPTKPNFAFSLKSGCGGGWGWGGRIRGAVEALQCK